MRLMAAAWCRSRRIHAFLVRKELKGGSPLLGELIVLEGQASDLGGADGGEVGRVGEEDLQTTEPLQLTVLKGNSEHCELCTHTGLSREGMCSVQYGTA